MKELHLALLQVQKELKTVAKDAKGQYGSYASLEQVLDSVEPILNKHGLLLVQFGRVDNGENVLCTDLVHIESQGVLHSVFKLTQEKPGPQGFGAALTYFRRYAILTAVCKATGEDPDANHQTQPKPQANRYTPHQFAPDDLFELVDEQAPSVEQILNKLIPVLRNKYEGKKYKDVSLQELVGSKDWIIRTIANKNKWQNEFIQDVEMLMFANSKPKDETVPF